MMRARIFPRFFYWFFGVAFGLTAVGAPEERVPDLEAISSHDPAIFATAAIAEKRRFDRLVGKLIYVLNNENNPSMKDVAVQMLAGLRSPEAIPSLMAHLHQEEMMDTGRSARDVNLGKYPCALALVEIGIPAASKVIQQLTVHQFESPTDVTIAAHVLERILGHQESKRRLELALAEAQPQNRTQLEKALQVLQSESVQERPK